MTPEVAALHEACRLAREIFLRELPHYEGVIQKLDDAMKSVESPGPTAYEKAILTIVDRGHFAGASWILIHGESRLHAARQLVKRGLLEENDRQQFRRAASAAPTEGKETIDEED